MRFIFFLCLTLGWSLTGISPSWGQGELLSLQPPLSEVFPSENTLGGVHVKYPVLLNDHTILHPDATLRFIYLDPSPGTHSHTATDDGSGSGFHSHVGPGGALVQGGEGGHAHDGGAAAGWGNAGGSDAGGIFDDDKKDDAKRSKTELQTETWTQKFLFDDALARATELGTTFVYFLPSQDKPTTATLDLPEGMLLAEVDGHVRVLGLKEESRPFVGGVRPGDEIRSFDNGAPLKNLNDFMRVFAETKRKAKTSGNMTYAMVVWRPDTKQTVAVQVAAPPAIPSFF